MANLFFVHTPMQLFVAQQIIYQESLMDNIMIFGYNGTRASFVETYQIMEIPNMWSHKYFLQELNMWASVGFGDLSSFRKTINNYKFIKSIIKKHRITSIFFGDIDNYSHLFGVLVFKKYAKIFIYEEGSSHYTYKDRIPDSSMLHNFSSLLLDYLFYIPFFGFKFKRYRRHQNVKDLQLPLFGRYNILPGINKEKYDMLLHINELYSDSVKIILDKHVMQEKSKKTKILLITNDVYVGEDSIKRYDLYLDVLKRYFKSIREESILYIKLHPNESEDKYRDIANLLDQRAIKYIRLSQEVNIPVEYYLQRYKFDEIVHFMSSSIFYNGYIYPQCKTVNLFRCFYEECLSLGIIMDNVYGLYKQCYNY